MSVFDFGRGEVSARDEAKSTPEQIRAMAQKLSAWLAEKPDHPVELDKYRMAARQEIDDRKAKGVPLATGYARQFVHGLLMNADDEVMAGAMTPFEMVRRGTWSPAEAYRYAKAREDALLDDAREENGWLGTGAEIAGGVGSGAGLAKQGITFARLLGKNSGVAGRALASGLDGVTSGAVAGALEGNAISERGHHALRGGALGGAVGAAIPVMAAVARPVVNMVRGQRNPDGLAESRIAEGLISGEYTPELIARELKDATAAGQGEYAVVDAMGEEGRRILARTRQAAAQEFVKDRQPGQGPRLSRGIDRAFGLADDAPQSVHELASIAEQKLRPMREATLDNPPVITDTLQQAFDSPVARKGFAEGVRLEQLRNGQAFDPRRYGIAGFTDRGEPVVSGPPNIRALDLVKQGLDSLLEKNPKASTTEGRLYANARQNFLKELGATHSDYTRVREGYDGYGSLVDAEAMGREAAATPGRSESNARRFSDLNDFEQHAHRLGFARGAAEDLGSSMMENKAPGLTLRGDIRAQSLHQGPVKPGRLDPLQRYFERENAMYKTHAALDGMPAEKPEGVAKELGAAAVNAASGKLSSAGSSLVNTIKLLTSDNDTVRRRIAERLLLNGEAMDPASVLGLNDAVRRIETNRQLGNLARGGILGAVAVAPYATGVR